MTPLKCIEGRDSSVGMTKGYGMHGPEMESVRLRVFPRPFRPDLWTIRSPMTLGTCSFRVVKWPKRDVDHASHLVLRLKKVYN
jgi:hypothetical protein